MLNTKHHLRKKFRTIVNQFKPCYVVPLRSPTKVGIDSSLLVPESNLIDYTYAQETPDSLISNAETVMKASHVVVVGLYIPLEGELNLLSLMANYPHIEFCLPKVINQDMEFVTYKQMDELQNNHIYSKILEPRSNKIVVPNLIFVPGIAFDIKGYRLGRGKGYYDRYLTRYPSIQTIGVTLQEKLLERLPREPHDCKMHCIITEHIILQT